MDWHTHFGLAQTDLDKVNTLLKNNTIKKEEHIFKREHSIFGIVPFIKKTFPHARIVPIVVKSSLSQTECDKLAQQLFEISDEQTLIIASVDFSHYLPAEEADLYDKESISALQNFDLGRIYSLDRTKNFDSPISLYPKNPNFLSRTCITTSLLLPVTKMLFFCKISIVSRIPNIP